MSRANGMRWDAAFDTAKDNQQILGERQVTTDNFTSAWWTVKQNQDGMWTLENRQGGGLCAQPDQLSADAVLRLRTCGQRRVGRTLPAGHPRFR